MFHVKPVEISVKKQTLVSRGTMTRKIITIFKRTVKPVKVNVKKQDKFHVEQYKNKYDV